MSLAGEWSLAIHRAIWFPVLYAMDLESEAVEVYPIDSGFMSKIEPIAASRGRKAAIASRRGATRKKAA